MTGQQCPHSEMKLVLNPKLKCEDCVALGDKWVHLRVCIECGYVGCCDTSKNRHATKHFQKTRHPVVRSLEPGETWGWCYLDEIMLEYDEPLVPPQKFPDLH